MRVKAFHFWFSLERIGSKRMLDNRESMDGKNKADDKDRNGGIVSLRVHFSVLKRVSHIDASSKPAVVLDVLLHCHLEPLLADLPHCFF